MSIPDALSSDGVSRDGPSAAFPPDAPTISWADLTAEEYIAAAGLAVIVGSVTWGVITRYLLAEPAEWVTELSAIAFAWTVFVGAAAVFKRGEHSAVDLLVTACPPLLRRWVQGAADLVVFATLAVVTVLAARFTVSTMDVPTTVLRLPQSVIYGAAATGFALMTVRHAVFAVGRLRAQGETP